MTQFVMPKLGADMNEGRLLAWCKKPGEPIERGEVLAMIETDKTNIDVESFSRGVVETLLVEPSEEWLPVGTPLAVIRADGEALEGLQPAAPAARAPERVPPIVAPGAAPPIRLAPSEAERVRASPSARKLAEELGIDPALLTGSGPGGRITREDVEQAAASAAKPAPVQPPADKQARMRQAIAAAMTRSKRETPHYYLSHPIDMGRAIEWLNEENLKRPVTERLLYGALLIKATALALRDVPELNAVWRDGQAVFGEGIHVGIAVSLRQGGLVAPALHNTDKQDLSELMRNLQDVVKRARAGSLRSSEYTDPTITVTNLGERGVETVIGVIFPPQVALVGFGKMLERPWIVSGQVLVRPVIVASLAADHRVSDGHRGALFLAAVERLLQEPERL
jgi:pyruvate dehydrogenase E2 component (dihydrolipoamide acetyltransferase)